MFKRKTQAVPMVRHYAPRFSRHISNDETILNAGSAYNVAYAMEFGDSTDNGILVVSTKRLFHVLDYGPITLEIPLGNIIGKSKSPHPAPETENLHITHLLNGVHAQSTFYCHPLFIKETLRILN